ncbi:ATPase, AAA-type, core [Artemisia annua]|uniref:ATPase, AAA-type, core n=1 Tax=Artemisia annua TaxID=35608 RepID=A0A2U1NKL6_ARTAN|nr:ATPase, AAA-type, core [Artemisia annua]
MKLKEEMEDDILIDATDRISQVPEFIIHHIMSFLDSPKDRVRMSVLSRNWFAITASFPILDFDIGKFEEFIPSEKGNFRDKFFQYVEYTTSRFCQQNVSAHTIKLIAEVRDATHVDILDKCLELVLLKGVQVLVVNIKNGVFLLSSSIPRYCVPNQLLSASSLTSLTLRGCELPSSLMADVVEFKSLKLLCLEWLHLDEEVIKYLTTNCPLLEELIVRLCYGIKRFCVYGLQNLQKVQIDSGVEIIDIEAPNLRDISVTNAPHINLASCKKLTTLTYSPYIPSKLGVLSDLLSNVPFIQNLILSLPYNCRKLKLSSSSLRKLVLIEKSELEEIDISTPNLLLFEYHVDMNLPALVVRESLQPTAEIAIYSHYCVNRHWFQKLKQFLDKKNGFKALKLQIVALCLESSTESKITTAKTVISAIGSIAAAAMVVRSISREYLPPEIQSYLHLTFRNFINKFSTHLTMIIYEFDGLTDNEIYTATQLYLASRVSSNIHRLKVSKNPNEPQINLEMEINEEFIDIYEGIKYTWCLVSKNKATREYIVHDDSGRSSRSDLRSLELTFHRKHKDFTLDSYLPFILNDAKNKKLQQKTVKLFTVEKKTMYRRYPTDWKSINLDHPAKFATVAMDIGMKEKVMEDLDRFIRRRDYYRKVGKAWKRGYLLYGPPGTGKSSLIAAMANYLNFDIYDLELTSISTNSELRRLLVATANRSILVVEDIDCSVELHDRVELEAMKALPPKSHRHGYEDEHKITLSGFLNFIDGLWSSCGDERIIIFTTNRKDKLDPALLRPGRMDVHIHMSYCTPSGFKLLASNYLNITQHNLFRKIEDLISEVSVTPAEVAEQLLKDDDPNIVLNGLVDFLDTKRKDNEEAKATTSC